MRFVWASATDVGHVREVNEDYVFPHDDGSGDGPVIVGVADGMGGHAAGEVASRVAIDSATTDTAGDGRDVVTRVAEANRAVIKAVTAGPGRYGMGTTLTLARLDADGTIELGHVGDSRAYLMRDGELRQLTTDHTLVAEMVASGRISPAEVESHPQRHLLTRALGIPGVSVDHVTERLEPGDRLLLCSDGLTSMVSDDEISEILGRQDSPDATAWTLVEAANTAGGIDNTTTVVVDVLP